MPYAIRRKFCHRQHSCTHALTCKNTEKEKRNINTTKQRERESREHGQGNESTLTSKINFCTHVTMELLQTRTRSHISASSHSIPSIPAANRNSWIRYNFVGKFPHFFPPFTDERVRQQKQRQTERERKCGFVCAACYSSCSETHFSTYRIYSSLLIRIFIYT